MHATVHTAAALGVEVVALHVHHGLSPEADEWLAHCRSLCKRWRAKGLPVGFDCRRLSSKPGGGDSVEAWARRERYAALHEMAQARAIDLVLLAHHRRDQAETFLLQALRGAGASGLAAMPRTAREGGVTWARPWLGMSRESIAAYARRHRLAFVEDASNDDRRFARSRLRRDVWPALSGAFADAELSLATASRLAADARAVLEETTASDLAAIVRGETIDVVSCRALSPSRRRFALVAWLRGRIGAAAPRTLIERLARELEQPDATRWPVPGGELRRSRGVLRYVRRAEPDR